MASSGHTACPSHTWGLGTELDVQVKDFEMGHGVSVHMLILEEETELEIISWFIWETLF